jgi:hypothetical protein
MIIIIFFVIIIMKKIQFLVQIESKEWVRKMIIFVT